MSSCRLQPMSNILPYTSLSAFSMNSLPAIVFLICSILNVFNFCFGIVSQKPDPLLSLSSTKFLAAYSYTPFALSRSLFTSSRTFFPVDKLHRSEFSENGCTQLDCITFTNDWTSFSPHNIRDSPRSGCFLLESSSFRCEISRICQGPCFCSPQSLQYLVSVDDYRLNPFVPPFVFLSLLTVSSSV